MLKNVSLVMKSQDRSIAVVSYLFQIIFIEVVQSLGNLCSGLFNKQFPSLTI